ncbi:MAG TPA: DUF6585 family protein [Ktedonobacteraceae bacterium]|nr:DUF6585 family protein [Ktedonobacteraceae bacterium]
MIEEGQSSQYTEMREGYSAKMFAIPYVEARPLPPTTSPVMQATEQSTQDNRSWEDQLAAAYQLGRIRKVYKNDVSTPLSVGISSCIVGIICLLPLISLAVSGMGYLRGLLSVSIFGFLSFSYGVNRINIAINNMIANAVDRSPRCYLCSHGVMLIKGKKVQAVRWDQVKTLQKFTFINSLRVQHYVLYPADNGEPLVLSGMCVKIKAFRVHCEQEIARYLLPECTAAYKADQTVNFGMINVTAQGLSMGDNGEKQLPWAKVGSIGERRGMLIICEKGTLTTWASIDVSMVYNLSIFLALIKQIKRSQLENQIALESMKAQAPLVPALPQSEWQEYE